MYLRYSLPLLWTAAIVVTALPQLQDVAKGDDLRLIKTSENDTGQWVTEDEKITKFKAEGINFIDVTDVADPDSYGRNSSSSLRITTNKYPTSLSNQLAASDLLTLATADGPRFWLKTLTDFYTRYYRSADGTRAATWLFNVVSAMTRTDPRINVTQFRHASYNQPSIIVTIRGNSPDLVVLGAHFDSTGGSLNARAPGADDNGSGVVVLLETLRVIVSTQFPLHNTLEFHFYSGEEGGLLGSGDVWRKYKADKKTVLAMVNTDQAGWSPSKKISIFLDYADPGLTAFVQTVVGGYIGDSTSDVCGYGCSDHASAFMNGFPAAYVADEPDRTSSPFVHSAKDSYDTIEWDTIMRHITFTLAFVAESNSFASILGAPRKNNTSNL